MRAAGRGSGAALGWHETLLKVEAATWLVTTGAVFVAVGWESGGTREGKGEGEGAGEGHIGPDFTAGHECGTGDQRVAQGEDEASKMLAATPVVGAESCAPASSLTYKVRPCGR